VLSRGNSKWQRIGLRSCKIIRSGSKTALKPRGYRNEYLPFNFQELRQKMIWTNSLQLLVSIHFSSLMFGPQLAPNCLCLTLTLIFSDQCSRTLILLFVCRTLLFSTDSPLSLSVQTNQLRLLRKLSLSHFPSMIRH